MNVSPLAIASNHLVASSFIKSAGISRKGFILNSVPVTQINSDGSSVILPNDVDFKVTGYTCNGTLVEIVYDGNMTNVGDLHQIFRYGSPFICTLQCLFIV